MTDGELVEAVRAGDTAAFGELAERHQRAVYRAALAVLGNTADAEDVAQEALVLAYRRLDQFRGEATVKTWMVSIAWRLSLSRRRRIGWKLKRMMTSDDQLDRVHAITPSPEARLLTAAGDLTQDELAAAMNIPAATFRGRLRDARLRLKEKLKQT